MPVFTTRRRPRPDGRHHRRARRRPSTGTVVADGDAVDRRRPRPRLLPHRPPGRDAGRARRATAAGSLAYSADTGPALVVRPLRAPASTWPCARRRCPRATARARAAPERAPGRCARRARPAPSACCSPTSRPAPTRPRRRSEAEAAFEGPVEHGRARRHLRGLRCAPTAATPDELRPITFERDYTDAAAGSVLVSFGRTRVLCTASVDEDVPRWMRGRGKGWVTAEYSMLPGVVGRAGPAARCKDGKPSGRTQEIQRLIGRSLRAVCDMAALGERQVIVDCDVLQADGGTRTASICGGYVALHDALHPARRGRRIAGPPAHRRTARAISVGIVDGVPLLDLAYVEDSRAEVDMNVVMTGRAASSRCRARPRACRSPGASSTSCSAWPRPASPRSSTSRPRWSPCRPRSGRRTAPGDDRSRLVLATANPDKAAEIAAILGAGGRAACRGRPRSPTWWRTPTRSRATPGSRRSAIAEATGRAGGGRRHRARGRRARQGDPGVRSARYAGEDATYADNVAKLLASLEGVYPADRTARFRTVALARWPDGREVVAEGVVDGLIAPARRGRAAASATTRCSCPTTATAAPSPRCRPTRSTRSATAAVPSGPPEGPRPHDLTATRPDGGQTLRQ